MRLLTQQQDNYRNAKQWREATRGVDPVVWAREKKENEKSKMDLNGEKKPNCNLILRTFPLQSGACYGRMVKIKK